MKILDGEKVLGVEHKGLKFLWEKKSGLSRISIGDREIASENPTKICCSGGEFSEKFEEYKIEDNKIVFCSEHVKKTWEFGKTIRLVQELSFKEKTKLLFADQSFRFGEKVRYAFVGGMKYTSKDKFSIYEKAKLPYPFSTYYKFRIPAKKFGGRWYRSAIYSKMPLALLTGENYFGLIFRPVERTSAGNDQIHGIEFSPDSVGVGYLGCFDYFEKNELWLGLPGKRKKLEIVLEPNEVIRTTLNIIAGKGGWTKAVDDFFKINKIGKQELDKELVAESLRKVEKWFWRAYDFKDGTFLQLPYKETPGFVFGEMSFSLTSYEAIRLVDFYKYYQKTKRKEFLEWSNRLRNLLLSDFASVSFENGRVWYNTLSPRGGKLDGYCYLDTGYAGYPGGQATIVLKLLEYSRLTGKKDVLKYALEGLEWIVNTQKRTGPWRVALKVFREIPARLERFEDFDTVGGTAECIRALLLGYKTTHNKKFLECAKRGLDGRI